ncbi:MAG: biopolymer transporter ExbD [Myxococcota bacterium]|jgi:biopolymer transport protein ExbD|nr:biopolymer transporter ExbD [Myxococcota bacterium]
MAFSSGNRGSAISEINVTPLVDVMLVLLIIFMVTTAAAEQKRVEHRKKQSLEEKTESLVELNLPVTPKNPFVADPETSKLVVVVDRRLRVFVIRGITGAAGEKPIADCSSSLDASSPEAWQGCFDLVAAALRGNHRMLKEGVYLQGDADAPYAFVGGVLETLRELGLETVDIVTNPHFAQSVSVQGRD